MTPKPSGWFLTFPFPLVGCFVSGDTIVPGSVSCLGIMLSPGPEQRQGQVPEPGGPRVTSSLSRSRKLCVPKSFVPGPKIGSGRKGPGSPSTKDKNIMGSGMFPVVNQSARMISALIPCPEFLLQPPSILSSCPGFPATLTGVEGSFQLPLTTVHNLAKSS